MKLELINELTESRQYRSKQAFKRTNAREVCDFAFMDMIAIWIMYNEYGTSVPARDYASRTAMFNSFRQFRQMSTDLYLNLHVISQNRTDLLASDEDSSLLEKIRLDERAIIRYLKNAEKNNLTPATVRMVLQRLENSLRIEDSNYRSIRRLAQNWPNLLQSQKRTILTRMNFFYRNHALRSEVYQHLKALMAGKGLIDPEATDPEKAGVAKTAAAAAAAGAAGFAGGYAFGKSLV